MGTNNFLSRLEFQQDDLVHNQVRAKVTHLFAAEEDGCRNLRFYPEPFSDERHTQGLSVNAFKKPEAQLVIDFVKDADDGIGEFRMLVAGIACHGFVLSVSSV